MPEQSQKVRSSRPLKFYAVAVTAVMLLILAAFLVVFTHAGYHTKVLVKLGLKEPVVKTNHALLAWENCLEKLDYDADVVFFGDSITYQSDFQHPGLKIVNLGYSGDTLSGMTGRIPMVQAVNPEKVFVLGGINGLTDANLSQTADLYENLLDQLRQALPDARIYVQSILPVAKEREATLTNICHNETIVAFNERLEEMAAQRGLTYIDIHSLYYCDGQLDSAVTSDGLHLEPHAYEKWEAAIKPYLDE